jgi:hypothetical protein
MHPRRVAISSSGEVSAVAWDGPVVFTGTWSSDGDPLWTREVENTDANGYTDFGYGIAADEQGNLLTVGGSSQQNLNINHDAFLRRYSADGLLLWTRFVGELGTDDFANSAAASPDGYYVACGASENAMGDRAPWVTAIGGDNNLQWSHFGQSGDYWDEYRDVAVAADGSIVVAGVLTSGGEPSISIGRLDPDGSEVWSVVVDNFDNVDELGLGVAVDSHDRVLVAAESSGGWLAKYSPDGEELIWTLAHEDAEAGFADVAVDGEDYAVVCGARPNELNPALDDLWVAKVSP